jgi:hypothetical protein
LRKYYPQDRKYRVFSKYYDQENKADFKLDEFLFDIHVCEIGDWVSQRQSQSLKYVSKSIWQIESEFAKDTREAFIDFSKLVTGNAENKLFIGPITNDPYAFIKDLVEVAKFCTGKVYLALLPHPSEWEKEQIISLLKYEKFDWHEL